MSETEILQKCRVRASKLGIVLFRNNVGALEDKNGRWVKFGLADNSPDLIGWKSLKVTADMVGEKIAVFVGIEVKTPEGMKPKGKKQKEHFALQQDFVDAINNAGGIGKIICSEDDL